MKDKDIQKDYCEHRVMDYNQRTGRLWHSPYCAFTLEPEYQGKIKCLYLGNEIEISVRNPHENFRKVKVNVCDLGDNHKKPKINFPMNFLNFIKSIFKK